MVGKLFNKKLYERQKLVLSIFFFVYLVFYLFPFKGDVPKYSSDNLRINVNKASKEELILVPYIGEKTAKKILEIRNKYKEIKNFKYLEKVRNFPKFKAFIKIHD